LPPQPYCGWQPTAPQDPAMSEPASLSLLHHFAALTDPRDHRARKHELSDILVIALCATLCGAESWPEIEEFGNAKQTFFARFLKLPNGIPSHDTFNRVFAALNPAAFQDSFTCWINAVTAQLDLDHLAVDGKSSRGSAAKAAGLGCLHTVSVWSCEHGLCFAQRAVAEKSNEITAIPPLLQLLELEGALVTIDALGCQKEVASKIVERDGDYVLAVKENQPKLYEDIAACFKRAFEEDFEGLRFAEYVENDKGHGREEQRCYTVIYDPEGLRTKEEWKGLKAIIAVSRERGEGDKYSCTTHYYISSAEATIERFARAIRGHWGIENGQHWVLDVVFGEDRSRARAGHAAENLAWLRRMALSLIRQDKSKGTIKGKRKRAGWNDGFLLHLLDLLSTE
jgi:predicted transposase YbfD/YdcC